MGTKLNKRQQEALAVIGADWSGVPTHIASTTLLALKRRGLVEMRDKPGSMHWLAMFDTPYNGGAYQWRIKPNGIQFADCAEPMVNEDEVQLTAKALTLS